LLSQDAVGTLRVEVIDSGVGVAEENQQKVFGEFAQFDRNKLQGGGGSGLGLWISKRIISMQNVAALTYTAP
jgi:signal transduction histidine kinase